MDYCAGIDVSLELSNLCGVHSSGKIVHETKVASEQEGCCSILPFWAADGQGRT